MQRNLRLLNRPVDKTLLRAPNLETGVMDEGLVVFAFNIFAIITNNVIVITFPISIPITINIPITVITISIAIVIDIVILIDIVIGIPGLPGSNGRDGLDLELVESGLMGLAAFLYCVLVLCALIVVVLLPP